MMMLLISNQLFTKKPTHHAPTENKRTAHAIPKRNPSEKYPCIKERIGDYVGSPEKDKTLRK